MATIINLKDSFDSVIRQQTLANTISTDNVTDQFDSLADELLVRGAPQIANTGALSTADSANSKMFYVTGVGFFYDSATGPANGTTIFSGVSGRFWKLAIPEPSATVTTFAATDGNGFDFTVVNPTTTPTLSATTTVADTRIMVSNSGAVTGYAGLIWNNGTTTLEVTGGATFSADITVPDEVYGVGWNGSLEAPTKNAVYDKIQSLAIGGTVTSVAATAPAAGFTISGSPITTAGTFTFALADDLAAIEALATTGIVRRTASNTWSAGTAVSLTTEVTGDLPFANLAQGSALSVLGVTGNATADVASIAAGTDNQVLRRSGTSVAFGAINLASSDAVIGNLSVNNLNSGSGAAASTFWNGTGAWVAPGAADVNLQVDNYTTVLTDAYKTIEMDKATANTLTIPLNATVAYPVGTVIFITQIGAGQTTIAPTGGVTLQSEGGADKIAAQYGEAYIRKRATDTWILVGNITT